MNIKETDFEDKLMSLFFPYEFKKINEVKGVQKNFVHYTTANAAMNMIKTRQVWMRQPYLMNDHQEMEHGLNCLKSAYISDDFQFKKLIDQYYPNLSTEIENEFDTLLRVNRQDVYLFCVSEHENTENDFGRLSMWRAYGKEVGIAIVMKHDTFFTESPGINCTLTPVAYHRYEDFLVNFQQVAKNIIENPNFIKSLDRDYFKNVVLTMFRFAVLSTKHIGFSEEKEWRIIYSPGIEVSKHLEHCLETINGVPQEVYKIPLRNDPAGGLVKIELNDLIERVIIGPTHYPLPLYKAFVKMLSDAGVDGAQDKVWVSDIPLRL